MMNSFNCTGRLVEDPKLFIDKDGINRTTFTLAVDRDSSWKYDDKNADYLDFIAWREVSNYIMKRFKKGDLVTVINARAKIRNITDSNGNKKRKLEFVVDRVYCSHKRRQNVGYYDLYRDEEDVDIIDEEVGEVGN